MSEKKITRRSFIKVTSATAAAMALDPAMVGAFSKNRFDSKGLPTRVLGKTGVHVPLIGIGTGTRFCSVKNENQAIEILNYALDHGIYYWDTAHGYGKGDVVSEERLGRVVKHRRKEIFLATKVRARDSVKAKKQIEKSLNRLKTDHLDLLQIHAIESLEDLAEVTRQGGLYDVVRSMKDQGITRYIGFSGHSSAKAMAKAARDLEFDSMLVALNHYRERSQNFEENVVPVAAANNLGIMVMKVVRPRETVKDIATKDLISYALSLKYITGAVIGIDSMQVLKENIALVKNFKPLEKEKMNELRASLDPFFQHRDLEWMRPGYQDGHWV
jgi:aryl-alcohol dehydrogenase-like predicted oxidoreductase